MDSTLRFWFGPPEKANIRYVFDQFQKEALKGESGEWSKKWTQYEKTQIEFLFGISRQEESGVEIILSEYYGVPLKVISYFYTVAKFRGVWIGSAALKMKDLELEENINITFPPPRKIQELLASSIGLLLGREFIYFDVSIYDE